MKYDAFISYRHGELDGLVAEKLHKMLEAYRIPAHIAKKIGRKKLSRVFRDREELPTSSNLSDSINEALENSSFMLLICSRRTCESMWVLREVERFGELHGKDRIVALLIDGEPDESFPPDLRERVVGDETIFVEPLAADIRAATHKGSLRLLKEEKLRLLAPILGCAFDDLRRRHRRRKIQQITTIVGTTLAVTSSFGIFSTYQYWQIDRQMQLKLENQSYVLAEYSAAQLAAGNPDLSLLLAMSALPDNLTKPERPLVAEAELALANTLGIYDVTEGFKPHKAITLPAPPSKVILSSVTTYAAIIYPYELAVLNPDTGKLNVSLPTVRSALADASFLSDSILVFTGEQGITAYDVSSNEALWRGKLATRITVSPDNNIIAAVYKDEGFATIYADDGHELMVIDFNHKKMRIPLNDSFINPHDTLFALSDDGRKLAVSFADGSLSVFDTSTGQETPVRPAGKAIHYQGGFYGDTLLVSLVEKEPYYSGLLIYDAGGNILIKQYSSETLNFIPHIAKDGLYAAFDNQVMTVDTETGELSHIASAGQRIMAIDGSNNSFLLSENDGIYRFTDDGRYYESEYVCHFLAYEGDFALTGSRDSNTLRILKHTPPAGNLVFAYDKVYQFSEARISQPANRLALYSHNGLRLYDLDGNFLAETEFPDPQLVVTTEFDAISGNIAVIYENIFRLYAGESGFLILEKLGKKETKSVIYTDFGVSVLDASGIVTLYDLATGLALMNAQTDPGSDYALPLGKILIEYSDGKISIANDKAAGELVGAGKIADGSYMFAIADGVNGKVFTSNGSDRITELFTFTALGQVEVYFLGGYVFVSPLHGQAAVYTHDGTFVRSFSMKGYLAEVFKVGEYIAAGYVSSALERYTYLLTPDKLETKVFLPGFLGEMESGRLMFNSGKALYAVNLHNTQELKDKASLWLNGRELSPDEIKIFKVN